MPDIGGIRCHGLLAKLANKIGPREFHLYISFCFAFVQYEVDNCLVLRFALSIIC